MRLHLLRHAPVQLASGVCYGASDVAAQNLAPSELDRLRAQLPAVPYVWSSPLRRCVDLALQIAPPQALHIEPRLREMAFGRWELQRFDDLDRAAIDAWALDPWGFVPPGGESAMQMSARVLAAMRALLEACGDGEALIVAHAGPLRVIRGRLLGLPRSEWLAQPCTHAQLMTLDVDARALLAQPAPA